LWIDVHAPTYDVVFTGITYNNQLHFVSAAVTSHNLFDRDGLSES